VNIALHTATRVVGMTFENGPLPLSPTGITGMSANDLGVMRVRRNTEEGKRVMRGRKFRRTLAERLRSKGFLLCVNSLCVLVFIYVFLGREASELGPMTMTVEPVYTNPEFVHGMRPINYSEPPTEQSIRHQVTRVAIFADSSLSDATQQVLSLVHREQADMVLHSGDLDYTSQPDAFQAQIDQILGLNFPYFFSPGNYETSKANIWSGYMELRAGILKSLNVSCTDGIQNATQVACNYMGISFVLSNISRRNEAMEKDLGFLDSSLDKLDHLFPQTRWKFCSWHGPHISMQLGFRPPPSVMRSPLLVEAYEHCRKHGAIVISGHEHYYTRTHTITSFKRPISFLGQNKIIEDGKDPVPLLLAKPGASFSVVNGLGGHSLSAPSLKWFSKRSHLAAVHPLSYLSNKDPGGKLFFDDINAKPTSSSKLRRAKVDPEGLPFGVLFCDFPVSQSVKLAECYFKTISDQVTDRFLVSDY